MVFAELADTSFPAASYCCRLSCGIGETKSDGRYTRMINLLE